MGGSPGAFQEFGQQGEHRRCVTLGGWRFAQRQPDFSLGHGKARYAVDHAQHVFFLIAEMVHCRARDVVGAVEVDIDDL